MNIGSILSGGLTSLLSGGALGIFGAIGTGVLDVIKTKQKNKHELDVLAAQAAMIKEQGNNAAALEIIKLQTGSYDHDKATYIGAGPVDMVRGLVRPVITMYLVLISTVIALWALKKVGLEPAVVAEIAKYSVYTCLELTGICIVWYFGSREIRKINTPKAGKK